ncbi:thioredoxin-domain-containing protein [Lentinus tigrinus ALCF2SS1-7]|uniref:Thioredoxin-domain-containing protein n=1 Tax=Lentinus tigrinus ALCF2SS1-6 TaxID=1328759 RepID=A0A5C2SG39_9APHY|nr:thioredoxin-domain-containing protein [Lentinus tigrinus ALCF2SS1-6]RPD74664.1 thioredoxin-domain-containing protein [Lentinus tigrinus ALCF2SS1-7]
MLAFARLSFSLLVSSIILASTALPVESSETELLVLTPDDFDSTIANGVWFIEHFSPYCRHCRDFAPTWTQLVEETEKKADPGIRLAQVNCAVHGDLCRKNGVEGYPQMNLYRDGKYLETFRQSRDVDILTKYITAHAEPRNPPAPEPPAEEPPAAASDDDELLDEIVHREAANPNGVVMSLDENNFQQTVDKGHVFVKFFAPWCGHCKKLAPIWKQLGSVMQNKLNIAEVDCEAHSALCKKEGITGYPMLHYYGGKGAGQTEYTGGRKIEQLQAFAEKVAGPGVQELKYGELETRVAEQSVFYLFLHSPSDKTLFKQVVEASNVLFGSPALYTSTSSSFYDHFNIQPGTAAVLALKDHDPNAPAAVYNLPKSLSTKNKQELANWIMRNRLPGAVELDRDNFQDIMNAPHKPLVVIVATSQNDKAQVAKEVIGIARKWRDAKEQAPVVFTWMDADAWGSWLKSMYGIKANMLPMTVVADHSRLVYYDTDPFGEAVKLTASSLFPTINGAARGTLAHKNSENFVERLARYLNNKLIALELYVVNNPWHTAFFAMIGMIGLGLGVKKLLAESDEARDMRKGDRLD